MNNNNGSNSKGGHIPERRGGMTHRELLAAMALQGMLSHVESRMLTPERLSDHAYMYADAMIERGKK